VTLTLVVKDALPYAARRHTLFDVGIDFDDARQGMELSQHELWLRYFALGGNAFPTEFEAYLTGALDLPGIEERVLVQALNEREMELASERRWPDAEDESP
jgi:hypothetical protein